MTGRLEYLGGKMAVEDNERCWPRQQRRCNINRVYMLWQQKDLACWTMYMVMYQVEIENTFSSNPTTNGPSFG